jgi:hypothetical protein
MTEIPISPFGFTMLFREAAKCEAQVVKKTAYQSNRRNGELLEGR